MANGGLPHAQMAAREPDSDRQTLDQEIEGSNPSSPANTTTPSGLATPPPRLIVSAPVARQQVVARLPVPGNQVNLI